MENTFDEDDHLHLPQDVLIQILVFLPVISLLRFKSVCKSWRALIQSSLFIDLHLNNTLLPPSNNNNFGTFIFQTSDYITLRTSKIEAFILSGGGEDGEFEELKLENLGFPPRYKVTLDICHHIFMVGSCNGLICIHDTKRREVSLWNPATRQFRLLPKYLILEGIGNIDENLIYPDFVAFGYDVKTKDYKVVQISCFKPYNLSDDFRLPIQKYIFRVQVYSLITDSWRLLEDINSFPCLPEQLTGWNHGVYLNGSYHFLGSYKVDIEVEYETETVTQTAPKYMIFSFDFTKEIFSTIQFPHHNDDMNLTYLGEKLAVFALVATTGYAEPCFDTYDLWVLNEHGVKESWTKLHSIELNCIGRYTPGRPRSISNNGEFALIYTKCERVINGVHVSNCKLLQLFNLVTKEVNKEFPIGTVIRAEVYKQSLVSIGGNDTTPVIGVAM